MLKALIARIASKPNKQTATIVNMLRSLPPSDNEPAFVEWVQKKLAI